MNGDNVRYLDNFGVEYIPKEIKRFIGNKNTTTNFIKLNQYDSIIPGYFCIEFINFKIKEKKNYFFFIPIYFLLRNMKSTIN